jgi:hypothetical protein
MYFGPVNKSIRDRPYAQYAERRFCVAGTNKVDREILDKDNIIPTNFINIHPNLGGCIAV